MVIIFESIPVNCECGCEVRLYTYLDFSGHCVINVMKVNEAKEDVRIVPGKKLWSLPTSVAIIVNYKIKKEKRKI